MRVALVRRGSQPLSAYRPRSVRRHARGLMQRCAADRLEPPRQSGSPGPTHFSGESRPAHVPYVSHLRKMPAMRGEISGGGAHRGPGGRASPNRSEELVHALRERFSRFLCARGSPLEPSRHFSALLPSTLRRKRQRLLFRRSHCRNIHSAPRIFLGSYEKENPWSH